MGSDIFIASGEFKEKEKIIDDGFIQLKEPKVREMDASDFAQPAMRAEIKVQCKFLSIIEDEVKKFLGEDSMPAKVGMYMKMVQDMMERK